eukprot:TRINITY_DN2772_c0_g1_i2.p1 TRINITY_DN2772_c0_g1~~TRINITY_DN2772_c0_g1_i2.p1  ORF type:complete len:638 (-),score=197.22 TRINITY_DN2772_c0_g1_i2:144-1802(-)
MPKEVLSSIQPDLQRFGDFVLEDVLQHGKDAELNPPVLVQYDGWGRRIDEIRVSHGWKELGHISAKEGLIAIAYEKLQNEFSRMYQMTKCYLFSPSSSVFSCPLAMTDGAAKLVEFLGPNATSQLREVFSHLISRDPTQFWTSGQWMTERTGGSDVGNTETLAYTQPDGSYILQGFKYFTSATTSQVAFGLARIVDKNGLSTPGSKGLSLFYIPMRRATGELNGITIHRLKNKLGTRAVPTAELELHDAKAFLIGEAGRGVPTISVLFNVTRIWTSLGGVTAMRRSMAIARDYSDRRHAFGKSLSNHPLHMRTLARLEVIFRGHMQLFFEILRLQGLSDCSKITDQDETLLRLLLPLSKLYTAREATIFVSECMESLGGTGYMEDATNIPAMFRDQQVNSIWEGTTNIISLDVLRAASKHKGIWDIYSSAVERNVSNSPQELTSQKAAVLSHLSAIRGLIQQMPKGGVEMMEGNARDFSFYVASTFVASLLIQHAKWSGEAKDFLTAKRWCDYHIAVCHETPSTFSEDKILALDLDVKPKNPKAGTNPISKL